MSNRGKDPSSTSNAGGDPTASASWVEAVLEAGSCSFVSTYTSKESAMSFNADQLEPPEWTYHSGEDPTELLKWYWNEADSTAGGTRGQATDTCSDCPQPLRNAEIPDGVEFVGKEQKPKQRWRTEYTKRCSECGARARARTRGRAAADRVKAVNNCHPDAIGVVFVTLTTKNYPAELSDADAVRAFKKEVKDWRRTSGVKLHFAGGFDFFEVTTNSRDGSKNAHSHSVYVQTKYWPQAQMLKSWRRGGCRIERKEPHQAVGYCVGYALKTPVEGVRCKESWGACRGREYEAVLDAYGQGARRSSPRRDGAEELCSAVAASVSSAIGRIKTRLNELWLGVRWATSKSWREQLWYELYYRPWREVKLSERSWPHPRSEHSWDTEAGAQQIAKKESSQTTLDDFHSGRGH